jgi:hypothetical protein
MEENRRVCHLCLAKVIFSAFEHDFSDIKAKDGIGFAEQFPGENRPFRQIFSHTDKLGPLAWKNVSFHVNI